jgi:hypothetical protein
MYLRMYMCVCVCNYESIYYICEHAHKFVRIMKLMCAYVYVYIYIYIYIYLSLCTYVCTCIHEFVDKETKNAVSANKNVF